MVGGMGVTVDELRDYLSGTPPRIVPPNVRRSALRRIPKTIIVMGVFFTLFSVPFMVVFFPWRLLDDIALNTGGRVTQDGVVDACKATGMKENDRRVFSFEFSYIPGSGDRRTGSCYATGVSREAGTRGHPRRADHGASLQLVWTGSILGIEESRRLVPHQNATTMQVAISVVASSMWMIENPEEGVCSPEDLPHDYVLGVSKPYLGKFVSIPSDWTPLKHYTNHFKGYNKPAIDPDDVWQFKNFLVTDGD